MASSLFAASFTHRVDPVAANDAETFPTDDTVVDADAHLAQADDIVATDTAGTAADESPAVDPPLLLLLTDIADPPTGAVQVATESAGPLGIYPPIDPTHVTAPATVEMPAAVAAAAAASASTAPTIAASPPATPAPPVDPTPSGILYDEEAKRPWGKYLLFGLIALIGVALLSYAGWLLLRTKSFEVPDLTGVDEAVALNEISGNGWVIETERERSDEVPEVDHIVRTVPAAGEMLDEGETFMIVVSDGFELRTLPELTAMTLVDARRTLTDLRLVPIEAPAEFSEDVAAGTVIRWQAQRGAALVAGAQVLPDTAIVITASLGPEPRPAPNLANLTAAEATAALDALQLVTAQGEDVFSNDIEIGRVVAQDPPPETAVERGGTVTFQLSKGPDLVALPDLAGLAYPAAEAALVDAGLTVNGLLGTTEGTFVSASVDGEQAVAGATFPRGTGVDLIFL